MDITLQMLRQTMEMMRNPNAMQQAMRSQDLAMSQIENLPGGFSALRRMYEEVSQSKQRDQPYIYACHCK